MDQMSKTTKNDIKIIVVGNSGTGKTSFVNKWIKDTFDESYKLSGAVAGDADIFLVPSGENYEECIKLKKEKGYDIEIVEIKTFDDAIEYLENLKNKKE